MPSARVLSLCALSINFTLLTLAIKFSRIGSVSPYKASSCVLLTELGKLVCSLILGQYEVRQADERARWTREASTADEVQLNGVGFADAKSETQTSPRRSARNHQSLPSPKTPSRRSKRLASHAKSSSIDVWDTRPAEEPLLKPKAIEASHSTLRRLVEETFARDCWKLGVPAVMFTLQANLQYVAVANLSLPVFQCSSQLKILSTALCSVLMLHRTLSRLQWVSLTLLALGVALVQLDADGAQSAQSKSSASYALGLSSVIASCMSSGFASIYFELQLKRGEVEASKLANGDPPPSATPAKLHFSQPRKDTGLWVRNVQLSIFGLCAAAGAYAFETRGALSFDGFLNGFTPLVWLVVALQIAGGLLAACVIKYADNLAKSFATSISILLSFAASMVLLDFRLGWGATIGGVLVLSSTWLFNSTAEDRARVFSVLKSGAEVRVTR